MQEYMAILRSAARVQRVGAAGSRRWASSSHHDNTPSDVYTKNSFNTPFWRFVAVTSVMAFGYYRFTVNDKSSSSKQFRTLLDEANAASAELEKQKKDGSESSDEEHEEEDTRPFLTRYMEYHSFKPSELKQSAGEILKSAIQVSQDRLLLDDYKPPTMKRLNSLAPFDIVNPHGREPGTEVDTSEVVLKPRYIRRMLEQAEAEETAWQAQQ